MDAYAPCSAIFDSCDHFWGTTFRPLSSYMRLHSFSWHYPSRSAKLKSIGSHRIDDWRRSVNVFERWLYRFETLNQGGKFGCYYCLALLHKGANWGFRSCSHHFSWIHIQHPTVKVVVKEGSALACVETSNLSYCLFIGFGVMVGCLKSFRPVCSV